MATLKLRRGSSFTSPQLGEPFYNTNSDTLQLGISGSQFITFTKLDDINTGSLLLNGDISASGDITASNLRVENDIRLNGSIYLGDEEVDKIYISASLSGSLIPDTGSAFDLGTDTETWRNIYVDTASIGNITLDGITVFEDLEVQGTSSFQTVTELGGTLTQYSQSVESRLSQLETDSGSQEGRLDNLEIFTSSQEQKNTTLEITTSSLEQATSSLQLFTSSQEELNTTFATTGSNTFIGNQFITGSVVVSGSGHSLVGNTDISGSFFVSGAINFQIPNDVNADIVQSDSGSIRLIPGNLQTYDTTEGPSGAVLEGGFYNFDTLFLLNKNGGGYNEVGFSANLSRSFDGYEVKDVYTNENPGFYASSGSTQSYYPWLELQKASDYTDGRVTFNTPIISSGSLTAPLQEGYYWVGDGNGYNEQVPTSSFTNRIDSLEVFTSSQETKNNLFELTTSSLESRVSQLETDTGSQDNRLDNLEQFTSSQESINDGYNTFTQSIDSRVDNIELTTSSFEGRLTNIESTTQSLEGRVDNIELFTSSQEGVNSSLQNYTSSNDIRLGIIETETASLDQRLDSFESVSASYARTDLENTFTELQTFDDIEVLGTASFAYIESVTGSAKIIGDAFIILNNNLPGEPYAGLQVIDSGSTNTTASLIWDGDRDHWVYQLASGSTYSGGGFLSGPRLPSGSDISEIVYPTQNYILKGDGGDHVSSSRITDDGIQVEIETSLNVVGSITGSSFSGTILSTNGVVSGSSQIVYEQISSIPSGIVSGSSQVTITDTTGFSTFSSSLRTTDEGFDTRITDLETFSSSTDSLYEEISSGTNTLVSGSSQLTSSFDSRYLNTNGDGIVSGSSQIDIEQTTNYSTFSSSLDSRFDLIESHTQSAITRLNNIELTTESFDSRLDQLETDSGSQDTRITDLESTGSDHESRIFINEGDILNLEISESLLDGRVSQLETFSSSLDTEFLNTGGDDVVSGSTGDQLTGSFDQRYALSSSFQDVSSSYVTLIGDFDITSSLGDAAFYNVSSSISNGDPTVLGNAGAVKDYIDEQFASQGAISEILGGDGLSGGGGSGSITIDLDTGSSHFTGGVNSILSSSVDTRLTDLESFSSSLDSDFVTQTELANATGSLEDSLSTKLDTGSYNTDSSSFDSRIDNLESFSSSLDDGFVTQTELASATGALESADTEQQSRLSQLETETGSIETEQGIQDGRLNNLESFTSSIDTTIKTKLDTDGVVSGSSQISFNGITDKPTLVSGSTQITDGSDLVSGSVLRPNGDGVVSGSSQISFTGITDKPTLVSGSSQVVYTDLSSIPSGIVSGSTQITDGSDLVSGSVLRPGGDGVISGSDQLTGSLVDLSSDQTISGTKTFNDIVVNGTGSFAVIESVSGDAKIIGDAYIILNNDTPTSRYAGFKVLDSGSAGTTASFEYDGQTNDFFYQYTDDGGVTDEFGIALFGPEYNTKGSPTYLSNNTIPKGDGGHHLNDSNITDSGTLITLGSNSVVEGTFYATGTTLVSGSSQISYTGLSSIPTNIVSSSSDTSTIDITISNGIISAVAIGGIVSGSSQVSYTGLSGIPAGIVSGSSQVNADTITNFDSNVKTKLDLDGVHSGSNQIVQFSKVGIGTGSDATYELKVDGDIGATGDIVAYISSDRRLKENITRISDPIHKINQLSGYSFEWNEEKQNIYNGKDYGVVAQEVQEIFPELVTERESGYLGVKYDRLVSVLIEAVKELSNEVNELKSKLE